MLDCCAVLCVTCVVLSTRGGARSARAAEPQDGQRPRGDQRTSRAENGHTARTLHRTSSLSRATRSSGQRHHCSLPHARAPPLTFCRSAPLHSALKRVPLFPSPTFDSLPSPPPPWVGSANAVRSCARTESSRYADSRRTQHAKHRADSRRQNDRMQACRRCTQTQRIDAMRGDRIEEGTGEDASKQQQRAFRRFAIPLVP